MKLSSERKFRISQKNFIRTLMFPTLILLVFIGIFPLVLEIYVSFTNWDPKLGDWWASQFIAGSNYWEMAHDTRFIWSVLRTIFIVGGAVSVEFLLGLGLALLLAREIPGKKLIVSIIILPMMVVPAVNGQMMRQIFYGYGPLNYILGLFSGQPSLSAFWLREPTLAVLAIILSDIWQWTPLLFLILVSGISMLPEEPINAAKVLGASSVQIFRRIQLPMLKNIIIIALIIRILEALKLFDTVYIMTAGGPGYATETFHMYLYIVGIKFTRLGYLAADALVLLGLIALIIWFVSKPIREAL